MKKISLKGLDLNVFSETLDNGLDVIFVPYENKNNYYITYGTKYGSCDTEFTLDKKNIKVPDGIAHFLEHKMFESEDGIDPFTYFSESGTGSNASTSFDNTQYIVYGTKNFNDNLKFLINFVNKPYFTDENVLKEKGIIIEELKMYDDMPDFQLEKVLRENIYLNHPRRVDIGGDISSVNSITKDDLYFCYNNFYNPNNMFVIVVGKFDMKDALDTIKECTKDLKKKTLPKLKCYREKKEVCKKMDTINSTINVPKLGIGLKVYTKNLEYSDLELDLYLNLFTSLCFGSTSLFREKVREEKLIKNLYTEWESISNFKVFYLISTSDNPDKLFEYINEEFKNIIIREEDFERIKKVWIANEVKMIDYIDSTVHNILDDYIKYGKVVNNKIEVIRNLKYEKLINLIKNIDFDNISYLKMLDNKKKRDD